MNWLVEHTIQQIESGNMQCAFCNRAGKITTIENSTGQHVLKIVCGQCIDSKYRQHGWVFVLIEANEVNIKKLRLQGSLVVT